MSGRALAYLTDFFGTDSHTEVRKSTLQTAWWELIGSAFCRLGFTPNGLWIQVRGSLKRERWILAGQSYAELVPVPRSRFRYPIDSCLNI